MTQRLFRLTKFLCNSYRTFIIFLNYTYIHPIYLCVTGTLSKLYEHYENIIWKWVTLNKVLRLIFHIKPFGENKYVNVYAD